jgi:hypothetical protein
MNSTDSVSILDMQDPLDIRQDVIGKVDENEEDVEFVVVGLDEKDDIVMNDDDEDTMDAFEGDTGTSLFGICLT